jgi:hypothetical protein
MRSLLSFTFLALVGPGDTTYPPPVNNHIQATPGNPARAGRCSTWGGWLSLRLQAVDGEAIGAHYHAWRSR